MIEYIIPLCIILIVIVYVYIRYISLSANIVGYYQAPSSFAHAGGAEDIDIILTDVSYLGNISGIIIVNDDAYPVSFGLPFLCTTTDETLVSITAPAELGFPKRASLTILHGRLLLEDDETVYLAGQWVPIF